MAFVPPPSMFDDDDDKPYVHPATAHVGESSGTSTNGCGKKVPSPPAMSRIESRLDHCRKVLQKVPIELYDLRSVARDGIPEQFRGTYWRLLLGFLPLRNEGWEKALTDSDSTYHELLPSLLDIDPETNAPKVDTSEHRIDVDIPRTIPSLHFFACTDTQIKDGVPVTFSPNQQSLRRVLYLYAKCNPGLGYVQGMNEIVGHLLYAFATSYEDSSILSGDFSGDFSQHGTPRRKRGESVGSPTTATNNSENDLTPRNDQTKNEEDEKKEVDEAPTETQGQGTAEAEAEGDLEEEKSLCESTKQQKSNRMAGGDGANELVEADVFYCFQKLTAYVGDTFCRALDGDQTMGVTGAMAHFNVLLYCCDSELNRYMTELSLQPTFYAFRWITVLLTQEFLLPDVLRIWDFIFSFGNELRPALFFTCAAMLVLVRDKLLSMSFGEALPMLQNYPPPDDINQLLDLSEQLIATQGLDLLSKIQAGEVKIPGPEDEEDQDGERGEDGGEKEFSMPTVDGAMRGLKGAFSRFRSGSKGGK